MDCGAEVVAGQQGHAGGRAELSLGSMDAISSFGAIFDFFFFNAVPLIQLSENTSKDFPLDPSDHMLIVLKNGVRDCTLTWPFFCVEGSPPGDFGP